jgi:ABC-type glycerol-3-phosphate transport system substrate-binding protein
MLLPMRLIAILVLVLATTVAACGGGDESAAPATWNGPQRPYPESGELPVEEFRAYAESVDEDWERAPGTLAAEYTQLAETSGGPEEPAVRMAVDGDAVTVTRTGLADDSVAAERYVLELDEDDGRWSLGSARWEQRCQPMRGHQQFSPELCV